jgi:plasmid segregation protein ParM
MSDKPLNVKSIDDGFGDMKYDSNGSPDLLPSFVTSFKAKPETDFTKEETAPHQRYLACEVNGQSFIVGDYAMRLDSNIHWIGGEYKHSDSRFPILLKTVLGLMTQGQHETVDLLMMNLPIRYDTPERQNQLRQLVQGTHEVNLSYDGKHFTRKVMTIESVSIKKQPFGSLCDLILDGNGHIQDKELAKGFNVLVDIGARTVNYLTLDALEEQPELTTQTNDGMYMAYTQIGSYLEKELNTIIPDGKLPMIIQAGAIKGRDISPLIQTVYENHANIIWSTIDKLLINSKGFVNNLIFTGGGSELLRPYLEKKSIFKNINIQFLDRFATVRGLRKYGLREVQRHHKGIQIRVGSMYSHYDHSGD